MNPQDLATLKAHYDNYQAPSQPQSSGLGGFLQRNLSTIGSIAAPLAATALAPETGGLSLALLAAGGSTLGKVGENAVEHKSLTNDLPGAAVQGATGEIGGQVIGKGLGFLGKIVEKPVEKGLANAAEREASDAVTKEFGNIPKKVLEDNNLNSTRDFFKNTLKMQASPEALQEASRLTTGDNGIVSGTMRQILGGVDKVPTSNVIDATQKALIQEAGNLGEVGARGSAASGTLREVRDLVQNKVFGGAGSLTQEGLADPNNVFDTIQALEKKIINQPHTDAGISRANVFKATKQSLEDSLYGGGGVDKAVSGFKFSPEDEQDIRFNVSKSGGSNELADHIINGVNDAKSGKELRALQRPFVNASNLSDAAETAAGGALPKGAGSAGNSRGNYYAAREVAGALGGNPLYALPLAAQAATTKPALEAASKVIDRASGIQNIVPGGTTNFLTRLATQGATHAQQATPATSDSQVADTTQLPSSLTANSSNYDPFAPENVNDSVSKILAQGGKMSDVQAYLSNAKLIQDLSGSTVTPTQQKATTAAKNASDTLDQIESSFNQAGGGQGLAGLFSNIEGKVGLNSNASTYNQTATALGASLYKALGNTGTISDNDQKLIASLIPKITDTKVTANGKIAQLRSLLQQAQENAVATQ